MSRLKNWFIDRHRTDPSRLGVFDSISEAIGNTPLIRLHGVTDRRDITVYAKLEYFNPGGSIKDRAAVSMISEAEKSGALRPGGTIIEATSGNTGIGLALVAAAKQYQMIFVVPDKTSAEKIDLLQAYGAQVRVVPSSLPAEDPDFIWNYAQRLAESIDGSWLAGQYDNPANPAAHEQGTGPELWAQTQGKITHLIAGIGTGGTITGTARFLKSQGAVTVIGVDPAGSNYALGVPNATDSSREHAWHIEAIGHFKHPETLVDEWPDCYDPSIVDGIEIVDDASAISALIELARTEGILAGGSAGSALVAASRIAQQAHSGAVIVVIVPDSGRSYLSKYFSSQWRNHWGFHQSPALLPSDAAPISLHFAADRSPHSILRAWPETSDEIALISLREGSRIIAAEVLGYIYRSDLEELIWNNHAEDRIENHIRPVMIQGLAENISEQEISPGTLIVYVDQGFVVGTSLGISQQSISALPAGVKSYE